MSVDVLEMPARNAAWSPASLYESMYRVRRVEEEVARVYPTDKVKSRVHLSIGQEAVAVGACVALRKDDIVFGTYRGHAVYLAKGGDLNRMIAELYGKATGCGQGKAGSMHLIDVSHGVMGMSAVVGTTIPHAAGYAYALKVRRASSVVVVFFGDGATEEGVFYETLNFAALKRLPLLFVCENNGYAIHAPLHTRQANPDITARVAAFGVHSRRLKTGDVHTVAEAVQQALAAIRAGEGPRFLECPTYRWKEHVGPGEDFHVGYRSIEEARPWMDHDELGKLAGEVAPALRLEIESRVEEELRTAFAFAEASPFPPPSALGTDVYAS